MSKPFEKTAASCALAIALTFCGSVPLSAEPADFTEALSRGPGAVSPPSTPRRSAMAKAAQSSAAIPDNLAELPGCLFRGAELRKEQYVYLKQLLGVDVVVNLKIETDDETACRTNNLRCIQFPMKLSWPADTNIDWDVLRQAFNFVLDEQRRGQTVYFHCKHGSDRTGALTAALMIRRQACEKSFSKDVLWAEVEADLKRHHFHADFFQPLARDIKKLVYEFEKNAPWLCR